MINRAFGPPRNLEEPDHDKQLLERVYRLYRTEIQSSGWAWVFLDEVQRYRAGNVGCGGAAFLRRAPDDDRVDGRAAEGESGPAQKDAGHQP